MPNEPTLVLKRSVVGREGMLFRTVLAEEGHASLSERPEDPLHSWLDLLDVQRVLCTFALLLRVARRFQGLARVQAKRAIDQPRCVSSKRARDQGNV